MNFISLNLKYIAVMCVAIVIGVAAASAFGQDAAYKDKNNDHQSKERSFCSNESWSNSDRVSFLDLREMTIPATDSLTVDGGPNGGIGVIGSDRNDIVVRACVQTWGSTDEAAKASASNIRISTAGTIKAEGSGEKNWSVSFQLLVPRSINLDLSAHNGGISVTETNGSTQFETVNGGVHLANLAGDVKGRTTNGGVHILLSGGSWRGSGLDVTTSNGGVHIEMPENYAAHVEMGTVNGGFHSDIPALNVTTEDVKGDWGRSPTKHIETNLNGGGPRIKVMTTNGGVHISSDGKQTRL
jgi:hypothetical protein